MQPHILEGDFGNVIFSGSYNNAGVATSNYVSVQTEANLNFFKKIAILRNRVALNSLGLYSFGTLGRNNKVNFASLSTPKHLLRLRTNGCTWNPVGKVVSRRSSFSLTPVEYNGELCPDVFYGDVLERIFGTGREVRDLMATTEGKALFMQLVNLTYAGLGNSFYELLDFGQHPLIEDSDTNGWYQGEDNVWGDFKAQQAAMGGHLTIIDGLKDEGYEHLNVAITNDYFNSDFTKFTGLATALFDEVLRAQPNEMEIASNQPNMNGMMPKPILLVSKDIYNSYEDYFTNKFDGLDAGMQYFLDRKLEDLGLNTGVPVTGVLKYKGHWVVRMDAWDTYDKITNTKTYRCIAATPGVFGVGHDVDELNQYAGMGLQLTQKLEAPYQGKVYMDTTFKVGAGILHEDFLVNASRTFTPA